MGADKAAKGSSVRARVVVKKEKLKKAGKMPGLKRLPTATV